MVNTGGIAYITYLATATEEEKSKLNAMLFSLFGLPNFLHKAGDGRFEMAESHIDFPCVLGSYGADMYGQVTLKNLPAIVKDITPIVANPFAPEPRHLKAEATISDLFLEEASRPEYSYYDVSDEFIENMRLWFEGREENINLNYNVSLKEFHDLICACFGAEFVVKTIQTWSR